MCQLADMTISRCPQKQLAAGRWNRVLRHLKRGDWPSKAATADCTQIADRPFVFVSEAQAFAWHVEVLRVSDIC